MLYKPLPLATGYSNEIQRLYFVLSESLSDVDVESLEALVDLVFKSGCIDGIEIMWRLQE